MTDSAKNPKQPSAIMLCVAVGLGSGLGSLLRFQSAFGIMSRLGGGDLLATAIVNIVGSFVIMLFATLTGADGRFPAGPTVRQFVMGGLCGGYTTRSLQGLNTFILILDGHWFYGAAYVVAVVALSLAAAAVGYVFALGLNKSAALRPVAECRALS